MSQGVDTVLLFLAVTRMCKLFSKHVVNKLLVSMVTLFVSVDAKSSDGLALKSALD